MAEYQTTTVVALSGLVETPGGLASVAHRADVLEMIQQAEAAVVGPSDPGVFAHDARAALACRIATSNGCTPLAGHYRALIRDPAAYGLTDPAFTGAESGAIPQDWHWDAAAVVAFADKVTTDTRDVAAADVDALKRAGVADADIVRLVELVAFVSFQVRVIQGFGLIAETS